MRTIWRKMILTFLVISLFIPSIISQSEGPSAHLDISTKIADMGDVITFNASAAEQGSGNYLEFKMSYGDGSIDGWRANPVFTHSYDRYGEFEVTLDVRNDAGSASLKDTVVIHPEVSIAKLTATINGEPYHQTIETIKEVTEVEFFGDGSLDTDLSSTNLEYNFYFGDGRSTGWQNASTVKTTYHSIGIFSAYLIVRNTTGVESLRSSSIEFKVRVSVFAILSADPAITADKEQTIVFDVSKSYDANPNNTIIEYVIDYGDGVLEKSNDPIEFNHSYVMDGDFTVKLTVINDKGESDTASVGIKIGTSVLFTALLWGAIVGAILFFIISFFLGAVFIKDFILMSTIGAIGGAVAGLIIYLLMVNWLLLLICIIIIAVVVFLLFVFLGGNGGEYIDTEDEEGQPQKNIHIEIHQ